MKLWCSACGYFERWKMCPKCGRDVCRDCMETHVCRIPRSAHPRVSAAAAARVEGLIDASVRR